MTTNAFPLKELRDPKRFASHFDLSLAQLAEVSGLPEEDLINKTPSAEQRLHEMVTILELAMPLCTNEFEALRWYRNEKIPGLADHTGESLVKSGKADAVIQHLKRIQEGGFA